MSTRHALALGRTRLTHLGTDATGVEMKRRMPAHELRVEHADIRAVPAELDTPHHTPHVHVQALTAALLARARAFEAEPDTLVKMLFSLATPLVPRLINS
jgi:hypothetical protein